MSSKKRKASELQDEAGLNGNGHRVAPSTPKSSSRKSLPYVNKSAGDSVPYDIECPAKPGTEESDAERDIFRSESNPGVEELTIQYTVRPGSKWSNTRSYRNVKLVDQTFTLGQIIYVNRKSPAPKPPSEDAPESEVLEYDKANMWVGKIAQAKAENDQAVFLRVFWLYWPDELPMGRQPYHGDRELVMSNAMDIIDARTIACAAEVSHWDEHDDELDPKQKERFWRQTFDINKLGPKGQGGLSSPRTHCVCNTAYNPDRTMYKCQRDDCGIWNHEECLMDIVLQDSFEKLEEGTLEEDMDKRVAILAAEQEHQDTLGEMIMFPTEMLGQTDKKSVTNLMEPAVEEVRHESKVEAHTTSTPGTAKRKIPKKKQHVTGSKPWSGKLEATITISDVEAESGTVLATVKLLGGGKGKEKRVAKQWTVKLDCLKCRKPLE